jgi:hypothetical protein
MGGVIQLKTTHKLTSSEWARLNVIVKRYGAERVATQINKLDCMPLSGPIGYLEKMCQADLMENVKDSNFVNDLLKELDDRD